MDWKQTTYDTLCELFPQIDVRIIKATALDHGDDIESAVDFLVSEVLVCDVESQPLQITDAPPTVPVNSMQDSTCECSGSEKSSTNSVCEIVQPSAMINHKEEYECTGSLNSACNLVWETGKSDEINNHEQEESIVWLSDVGNTNCSSVSEGDRTNEDNIEQDSFSVSRNGEAEFPNLFANETEVCSFTPDYSFKTDQLASCADTSFGCEELESTLLSVFSTADVSLKLHNKIFSASEHCLGLDFSGLQQQQPYAVSMRGHETYPIHDLFGSEQTRGNLHSGMQSPVHHGANLPLNSKQEVDAGFFLIGKITNEDFQEDGVFESNSQPSEHRRCDEYGTSLGTMDCSSYNANIETLDKFVQDSSSDKMHLISVMEEICLLRLQAEKEQADAQVAKADAAKGELDTLMKVEEMRNTLAQAREANQMHAGEIYGEKAVLATESREFLSRLVQLKSDQAKVVSSLNELRAAMQTRFDLAAKEREAAEEEKDRKEASAREVLAMEEALVAKVAQESSDLEAEAEICTRLREFLIERGSIVDSLQGEMAVLLEDVETLKKQMEEGTLSSNSAYLSTTYFSPRTVLNGLQSSLGSNRSSASSSQDFARGVSSQIQTLVAGINSDLPTDGMTSHINLVEKICNI